MSPDNDISPMPQFRCLYLLLGLTACLPVYAHDPIPADWCTDRGTEPVIVEKFNFDEAELLKLKDEFQLHLHDADSDADKCGIVDSWRLANSIAQHHCNAIAPRQLSPVAYITGPEAFVDENHHKTYSLSEGLVGSCFVCPATGK
jgi:hypothetical protein